MVKGLGLPEDRLLEWSVEDGWIPLCNFLGKDVPQQEFPNSNPPKAWAERIERTTKEHHERAVRNMIIFGTLLAASVALISTCFQ